MAFKLKARRMGKLDAICAKLKQNTVGETEDSNPAGLAGLSSNNGTAQSTEQPANFSIPPPNNNNNNNNIVGKADLNTVEESQSNGSLVSNVSTPSKPAQSTHHSPVSDMQTKTGDSSPDEITDVSPRDRQSDSCHSGTTASIKEMVAQMREKRRHKPLPAASSSRRKSRKAATPRSITQVRDYYEHMDGKDELAEYELNNQNTNFPPDDPEPGCHDNMEDTNGSGQNSPNLPSHHGNGDDHAGVNDGRSGVWRDYGVSGQQGLERSRASLASTPLDLSVSKSGDDEHSIRDVFSSDEDNSQFAARDEEEGEDYFHPNKNLVIDNESGKRLAEFKETGKSVNGDQASHLKDFAESTMNELISMYGFGAGFHGDLSKQVPIKNYKQILQYSPPTCSSGQSSPSITMGGASYMNQSISSGDEESHDGSQPIKGIYANYVKSGSSTPTKMLGAGNKLQNDRFTSSSSFINAVYNNNSGSSSGSQRGHVSPGLPNYSKYLKRYNTGGECGGQHCKELGYREHYHCIDCSFQVFIKKEEMVRHYKWHRKREESLQHGFLRFSPIDDCTKKFGPCTHNGKQTHYHCLQNGCDKVYISTSDVQMHANYHRKDSAIMSEGFQRFRATEDCGTPACTFYGQRTTHFHCLRSDCRFTFKNKADMEKHKSYHQKDEVLGRDGFKKFMKYEHCMFPSCRYSKVSNHIHCIRAGCDYVLHSTAQLYSHKRKHERRDFESAYRKYRDHGPANQGAPSSNTGGTKLLLPRPADLTQTQVQALHGLQGLQSLHGLPAGVQGLPPGLPPTLAGLGANPQLLQNLLALQQGIKRPAAQEWDQAEPLELKKPRQENSENTGCDLSPSSTPSARSTPMDDGSVKRDPDCIGGEESLDGEGDGSLDGTDEVQDRRGSLDSQSMHGLEALDNDTVDLNGSLTLPIPSFAGAKNRQPTEPATSPSPLTVMSSSSGLAAAAGSESSQPQSPQASKPSPTAGLLSDKLLSSLPAMSLSSMNLPGIGGGAMPSTLTGSLVSMNPGMLLTVPSTVAGVLQPPKSVYTERREKDDSWKTYLVRYTANDPCNPRCQYLYKDHYHCKMEGCLVLFKSKDGVREHARFHELQDRITPIAYKTYEAREGCPEKCQYSENDKHYHCIWTGCTHVVPHIGPTFGRLEHYRIHEYARAAAGKSYSRTSAGGKSAVPFVDENTMRRRGRPPKYPKLELPKIPKVELSDEEIRRSQLNEDMNAGYVKVRNGFRVFSRDDPCPDERCTFAGKVHYHCARPRCFTITDRLDVLNLHAKDFHSFVKILEGYEFFDRTVSCRRVHCPNNQTNRHFHCTRPKCDYSFIRHSTMAQHEKKHLTGSSSSDLTSSLRNSMALLQQSSSQAAGLPCGDITLTSPVTSPISTHPLTPVTGIRSPTLPLFLTQGGSSQASVIVSHPSIQDIKGAPAGVTSLPAGVTSLPVPMSTVQALPASVSAGQLVSGVPGPLMNLAGLPIALSPLDNPATSNNPSVPLTVLLQRGVNQIPQPSWNDLKARMHYAVSQNCGRPFCKLKKKDHFHCFDCNQAFSDPARLRSHVGKHGIKLKRSDQLEIAPKPATNQSPSSVAEQLKTAGVPLVAMEIDTDEAQCLAASANMADSDSENEDEKSSSLNLNPSTFSEMIFKAQEQNKIGSDDSDQEDSLHSLKIDTGSEVETGDDQPTDFSSRSGRKIIKTKHEGFMNSADINLNKQRQGFTTKSNTKTSSKQMPASSTGNASGKGITTATRGMRDDSVPEGYSRWRYNEDCQYAKCAYKHSVTHFHCVREDCGYGFSDRSRLVQHTLRHERIDSITGGELQQYRINQDCEVIDCEYNQKMSHFHCKRCSYCCTDSSKVLTHRKYHAKMDNIVSQGFSKYLAMDDCGVNVCPYSRKQNHFHCVVKDCRAPVLGPTQMSSHKHKHNTEDS